MLSVVFYQVKAEQVDRLRSWLREAEQRTEELVEGFVQETVRHEVAYLIEGKNGPVLIYAIEEEDHQQGDEAYKHSTIPLDVEHKKVMAEALGESVSVEKLYEFSLPSDPN
jgi:Family of unknown function (DUF6176)